MAFFESTAGAALLTLGMSMTPVVELRGAIPYGIARGLPVVLTFFLAVVGNLLPVPLIMLLVRQVFARLGRIPWWEKRIRSLERRARLKGRLVRRYRLPGLVLLVAIPLPGTGAWTGALVASLLNIRLRYALPAITVGVLIAGLLTLVITGGVFHLVT